MKTRDDASGDQAAGWTVATLREYVDIRLDELDKRTRSMFDSNKEAVASALAAAKEAVNAALVSAEKGIAKADAASEKRFDSVNEFRGQLRDQQATLLPRAEADSRFSQLRDLIDSQSKLISELQRSDSRGSGGEEARAKMRAQSNWIIGLIVMVGLNMVGLVVTLIYFLVGKH